MSISVIECSTPGKPRDQLTEKQDLTLKRLTLIYQKCQVNEEELSACRKQVFYREGMLVLPSRNIARVDELPTYVQMEALKAHDYALEALRFNATFRKPIINLHPERPGHCLGGVVHFLDCVEKQEIDTLFTDFKEGVPVDAVRYQGVYEQADADEAFPFALAGLELVPLFEKVTPTTLLDALPALTAGHYYLDFDSNHEDDPGHAMGLVIGGEGQHIFYDPNLGIGLIPEDDLQAVVHNTLRLYQEDNPDLYCSLFGAYRPTADSP